MTAAYSNGLIGYVPNESTYDKGGYEVEGSHYYFLRPAPFTRDVDRVVAKCLEMVRSQL